MKSVQSELNIIRKQADIKDKGSKFLILKNSKDLTGAEKNKLDNILRQSTRLRIAYELKEEFRNIYETSKTVEEGKIELEKWLDKAKIVYSDAITTIRNHFEGICNPVS